MTLTGSTPPGPSMTGPAPFSKYRMAVIIIARFVPSRWPGAAAVRDTIAQTVATVRELAARGDIREIVLTGVNLGDFGRDGEDFFGLMQELDCIDGIDRYRISSIEPNLLTPEIIEWVAGSRRFMPHFHIPLQSGSNHILGLMRRRYRRELYAERVELIRQCMPHCAIGVDVIVGHPGETPEHFNETVEFLEALDISYLHVFTYSERDHTRSLDIRPVVPMAGPHRAQQDIKKPLLPQNAVFYPATSGPDPEVLLEGHVTSPMMEGYTDNYIKVTTPYRPEWANRIIDWQL